MRTTLAARTVSLALSLFFISFVGCGNGGGGGNKGTATPSPTATGSVAPTATRVTDTPVPTNTAAPTLSPTSVPTATMQPTPTATQPPDPTPTPTTDSGELDISICAPDAGPFSNELTNPFYPLAVGTQWILEGEEDGVEIRVEITALDETEVVAGVSTRVVEERELEDGELVEVSRNFFVQASDGTVCYYGEDVDDYEDGEIVGHDGAWRAGVDGAQAGILIPGDPQIGQSFRQEVALGIAEDRAVQVAAGEVVEVELATFTDTIRYEESSPLDTGTSSKVYARNVGLIIDDVIELVEVGSDGPALSAAKLLVEHNATDEDTGFQGFADGDPWNELTIANPSGAAIATVNAEGGLFDFGLTELFFETSEPENAEVPIDDVLDRLPEGTYTFSGDLVDAETDMLTARFTHDIPAGPELISPAADETGLDPGAVVVSWEPVSDDIDGDPIDIVGYQVIVEEDAVVAFPEGFAKPVFSLYLPASATSVSVPAEFMRDNTCYKYEVLAIEESGNQTLSSAEFETGEGCQRPEEVDEDPRLTQAKILIEHNATDEDTGFQGFADGDPWNQLTISGPGDVTVVRVTPAGGLFNFGLTELFFETSEPENADVPIDDVLDRLPEGTYTFRGQLVDGAESTLTATLTHDIPAGAELLSPEDGDEEVDPNHTVVAWEPVTTDIDGDPITIVGYQVIVEETAEPEFPEGFAKPVFSVYLPASVRSVKVPAEFMRGATEYAYEVLAIEESGNQTLASAEFTTAVVPCVEPTLDADLCDPEVATFTLESTNLYYPLHVGLQTILEGEEDGEVIRVERTVLEDTELVAGVETHVLEHKEFIDGEIHEIARNFYVESTDGTVCYFGEDVEFYEDGVLIDMHGSWRAGVDGAEPGIIMPAMPAVGDAYFQENAPGIAIDMGRVSDTGVSRTIAGVLYEDIVIVQDSNPMEGCDGEEEKVYVRGIGEVVDDFLEVIEVTNNQ